MTGTTLGSYRIFEELGRGGMGIVYKAEDTKLERQVALKVLPAAALASEEDRARFYREAKAAAALNHPNIVKMLDMMEEDGKHYLVMEYVSGGDLADLLKRGNIAINRILEIAIDLADALTRTHKLGIIHRDLKPENLLLFEGEVVKVTDFGWSAESEEIRNTFCGTQEYLAPEMINGTGHDAKLDIWGRRRWRPRPGW